MLRSKPFDSFAVTERVPAKDIQLLRVHREGKCSCKTHPHDGQIQALYMRGRRTDKPHVAAMMWWPDETNLSYYFPERTIDKCDQYRCDTPAQDPRSQTRPHRHTAQQALYSITQPMSDFGRAPFRAGQELDLQKEQVRSTGILRIEKVSHGECAILGWTWLLFTPHEGGHPHKYRAALGTVFLVVRDISWPAVARSVIRGNKRTYLPPESVTPHQIGHSLVCKGPK